MVGKGADWRGDATELSHLIDSEKGGGFRFNEGYLREGLSCHDRGESLNLSGACLALLRKQAGSVRVGEVGWVVEQRVEIVNCKAVVAHDREVNSSRCQPGSG